MPDGMGLSAVSFAPSGTADSDDVDCPPPPEEPACVPAGPPPAPRPDGCAAPDDFAPSGAAFFLPAAPATPFAPALSAPPAAMTPMPAIPPSMDGMTPPPPTLPATAGTMSFIIAGRSTMTLTVSMRVMAWLSSPSVAVTMIALPVAMTSAATGLYRRKANSHPMTLPNAWRPVSIQLIAAQTGATPTMMGSRPARR